jgi:putative tryptophan/tyrosine transport system substrate-binding protein
MRRRSFIAGVTSTAAITGVAAQPAASRRLAIFSPAEPSALMHGRSDNRYYRVLFDELRRLGHIEGQNLIVEKYGSEQNASGPAALAAEAARDLGRVACRWPRHHHRPHGSAQVGEYKPRVC